MAEPAGTIALITGANKGIGFETARQLARGGVYVLIGARDQARGEDAVAALAGEGLQARRLTLDVTRQDSIAAAVAEVGRDYGRLDILVNNAGVGLVPAMPSQLDIGLLREVLETNLFGAYAVLQAFTPLLKAAPTARVVNVSSTLGSVFHLSDPQWIGAGTQFPAYSISKAALNMVTAQFSAEFRGSNVKVNAVEPGFTKTDMTDHQGFQTVEVAAQVIVQYATLVADGPNGGYFQHTGRMPW